MFGFETCSFFKKKIAKIKIGQTLRKNDEVMLKEATKFMTVVILLFGG